MARCDHLSPGHLVNTAYFEPTLPLHFDRGEGEAEDISWPIIAAFRPPDDRDDDCDFIIRTRTYRVTHLDGYNLPLTWFHHLA